MTTLICRYAAGIVSSLALAGACLAFPQWPKVLGLEVATAQRRSASEVTAPGPQCEVFKARIEAKTQIIARLRSGELNLFEAAGWFACVNREPAEFADHSWRNLPGGSDEEKLCRQVIFWVRGNLAHAMPESEMDSFVAGLEARLSARLRDGGRVELPEWR